MFYNLNCVFGASIIMASATTPIAILSDNRRSCATGGRVTCLSQRQCVPERRWWWCSSPPPRHFSLLEWESFLVPEDLSCSSGVPATGRFSEFWKIFSSKSMSWKTRSPNWKKLMLRRERTIHRRGAVGTRSMLTRKEGKKTQKLN